jgi:hypothetical protein
MLRKYTCLLILVVTSLSCKAQQITDPTATEVWEPQPRVVTPGVDNRPPSDAIVLFDGSDLDQWRKPQHTSEKGTVSEMQADVQSLDAAYMHTEADWTVEAGQFVVAPGTGAIETRQSFGDMQLHIEWLAPVDTGKEGQQYSNSGVFLMGLYEVQVLNNYKNKTYANGQAGAVYKQTPPLVNASRPPGEWQAYDIIFKAPRFDGDKLETPAYVTVLHNGVIIQHHTELEGPTAYIGKSSYFPHTAEMPLRLQDHGNLVRYRNVWVRKL